MDIEIRRRLLEEKMNMVGLKTRNDSLLCNRFIKQELHIDLSVDDVVARMCKMKYLYEYTNYPIHKKNLINTKGKSWTAQQIHSRAKTITLEESSFPTHWPWLEQPTNTLTDLQAKLQIFDDLINKEH